MSKEDSIFINIILLLGISFGIAFIAHRYLPEKMEGFESKPRSFPVDAVIIFDRSNSPKIVEELVSAGVEDSKIHVVKPVHRTWSELGESLNQEVALNLIIERKWGKTLVISENVLLNNSRTWDKTVRQLEEFTGKSGDTNLDSTWDVILLGGNSSTNPSKTEYENLIRTTDTQCSYAYIVRGEYASQMRTEVQTGIQMMMKKHPQMNQHTVDGVFASMKKQDRWFMCKPSLAYRPGA
jgi:hypothetical protein